MRQVLGILKKERLYAKRSKCLFFQKSVKNLANVVSSDGVDADSENIDVIRNRPLPRTAFAARSFLRSGNYFKRTVSKGYVKPTPY